ncbi:hypothetical protein [Vibrio splendidus]|uniref:hypothetical protein n=1 Tax=Vibrio splendidus TaxID=29497 RepID=UPI000C83B624|nr:hypothetical protein [Vibrio splendidus]PMI49567.1 hypothetical protein BCU42_14320 [Vibrio splendidus]
MSDFDDCKADTYEAILDAMGCEYVITPIEGDAFSITAYIKNREKEGLKRKVMITNSELPHRSTLMIEGQLHRLAFQKGVNGFYEYSVMVESDSKRRDWSEKA